MKLHRAFRVGILSSLLLVGCASSKEPAKTALDPNQKTRRDFLAMIDRPRVELAAEVQPLTDADGLSRFHFVYSSDANNRVPGLLYAKPEILKDGHRHPVVIVAHGTNGKKDDYSALLTELAQKDFIAVAIDGRYHGERGKPADYNAAIAQAFTDGKSHPLYYDTVWDMQRLLDYLDTRSDVDPQRIGMIGFSKGGIETWMTAAIDDRIAVAVPTISGHAFEWALRHDAWHARVATVQKQFDAAAKSVGVNQPDEKFVEQFYDRVIPGIHGEFDCPNMLPLITPRPLMLINGDKDPNNPLPGVLICQKAGTEAYAAANAGDHFKSIIEENTPHKVNKSAREEAVVWFEKWLKNEPTTREN